MVAAIFLQESKRAILLLRRANCQQTLIKFLCFKFMLQKE